MRTKILSLLISVSVALFFTGCPSSVEPTSIASTIVFADGVAVTKALGSGVYTNGITGVGTGAISYTSGTPTTATVNASTGEVSLKATGTTVITASKAETVTHGAVSASYTLTVTASNNTSATLSALTVSDGLLFPAFSELQTNYDVVVNKDVSSVTLTATPADSQFTVSGVTTLSSLVVGDPRQTTLSVSTQSGVTKEYVIRVYRAGSDDKVSAGVGLLKKVPAGSYKRDSTATNVMTITKAYWMSQHEVTRAQFDAIMDGDPSRPLYSPTVGHPANRVNWYQAIAFCNKLSLAEELTLVYTVTGVDFATLDFASIPVTSSTVWNSVQANWDANGYRLPTEAEWMWAAMGATNAYTKFFAGYNTEDQGVNDYAWISFNSSGTAHQVGTKKANELGIYDLSGNISEWCWDADNSISVMPPYPYTANGSQSDYRGPAATDVRVLRGGSFAIDSGGVTVSYRSAFYAYFQSPYYGLRVIRN